MTFHVSIPSPMDAVGANRRRHGRVRCEGISCSLGEVLDVSASGARIRTKFNRIRPGEQTSLMIDGIGGAIAVRVQVEWIVPMGGSSHDQEVLAGIRYLELNDEARQALIDLARASAGNPMLRR